MTEKKEGILTSLRKLGGALGGGLINATTDHARPEGSNVDVVIDPASGEEIALCHLSAILPFTHGEGSYIPQPPAFEDVASIALAAHHLNTGDGSIVPEIQGLNERCKVRFTMESADSEYTPGVGLEHVVDQINREPNTSERIPCAFIGAYRSAVSIPMSIVSGLFGYPQISGASTSVDLDDKSQYPLFGRTVPSDEGTATPIIKFMHQLVHIKHLAVINVNDAYGNAFVQGLRRAAAENAPNLNIQQIPLEENDSSIKAAVATLKASEYRYVFALVFTNEIHDALLTEAFKEGVAGNGVHNWFFGDSFIGVLDDRSFPRGSPLHLAYRYVQ